MEKLGASYISYEKKAKSAKLGDKLLAQLKIYIFIVWSSGSTYSKAKSVSFATSII